MVMAQELITHLAESLHFPNISMDFRAEILPEVALELLNHVKNLSLPIMNIELWMGPSIPAKIHKAFLDEGSRITESLVMGCDAPVGFHYSPSKEFRLETFEVQDGPWVNLSDYINCKHLEIRTDEGHTTYSVNAQSLNQFFKAWQNSSCRLESLDVFVYHCPEFDFEEVIMGLNGTNITSDGLLTRLDIEPQDGKKATITLTQIDAKSEIKS